MLDNRHLIGGRLKKDIFSDQGVLLLSVGTVLTLEHLNQLSSLRYSLQERDIELDERLEIIETQPPSKSAQLIHSATEEMKQIFEEIRITGSIPLQDIQVSIVPVIQQAVQAEQLFTLLHSLQSRDDYTYRHNIGVGVIATLIGTWLHLPSKELALLTMSATLHDVGKTKIPLEILNKPGKLTTKEFAIIKKHTIYGYELIKQTEGTSNRMALVALQHHEREDGVGYPYRIKGEEIDFLSKIVAVADIFHAMLSKRVYHDSRPFYQVINQMSMDQFGKLDPKIVKVFIEKIMSMMVGHDILLNDGRKGRIILIHPTDPIRPLIVVNEQYIDLRYQRNLEIENVS